MAQCSTYKKANPEKVRQAISNWNKQNPDKAAQFSAAWRRRNYKKYMLTSAKTRSKKTGIEFSITEEDFYIPEYCPISGVKFVYSWEEGYKKSLAPSMDRIDNSKGYIPGNVRVISDRANNCKKDLTLQEIKNLYLYSIGEL